MLEEAGLLSYSIKVCSHLPGSRFFLYFCYYLVYGARVSAVGGVGTTSPKTPWSYLRGICRRSLYKCYYISAPNI